MEITQIFYRGNGTTFRKNNQIPFRIPLQASQQVRKFKVSRQWALKEHLTKDILVLRSWLFPVHICAIQ